MEDDAEEMRRSELLGRASMGLGNVDESERICCSKCKCCPTKNRCCISIVFLLFTFDIIIIVMICISCYTVDHLLDHAVNIPKTEYNEKILQRWWWRILLSYWALYVTLILKLY